MICEWFAVFRNAILGDTHIQISGYEVEYSDVRISTQMHFNISPFASIQVLSFLLSKNIFAVLFADLSPRSRVYRSIGWSFLHCSLVVNLRTYRSDATSA